MRIEIDVSDWITDRKSLPATNNNYMPVVREKYIKNGRFPKKAHYASMIMSDEAKTWKQYLTLEIGRNLDKKILSSLIEWLLHIRIEYHVPIYNKNKTVRRFDIDGPIKFILDAFEDATGIDDKMIKVLEVEKINTELHDAKIAIIIGIASED